MLTSTPLPRTVNGSGPAATPNRPRSGADGLAASPASAEQTPKAPVVLVPGTGLGPARPIPPLIAVTKVFTPSTLPAVVGTTAQLDALVRSLMITASERPPEGSRGSASS